MWGDVGRCGSGSLIQASTCHVHVHVASRCGGQRRSKPPLLLYTDAMFEATATVPARIGVAIYDPLDAESRWRHLSADVPAAIISRWRPRKQYITQLETLTPVVALLSRPEQFRGRDVICFVDIRLWAPDTHIPRSVRRPRRLSLVRVRRVGRQHRRPALPGRLRAAAGDGEHALSTR